MVNACDQPKTWAFLQHRPSLVAFSSLFGQLLLELFFLDYVPSVFPPFLGFYRCPAFEEAETGGGGALQLYRLLRLFLQVLLQLKPPWHEIPKIMILREHR